MQADFELTPADLVAFVTCHNMRSPTVRRQRLGCVVIGTAALSLLPAMILATTDQPLLETALAIWPLLAGPVGFLIVVIPLYRWLLQRNARRMLAEGDSSGDFGPCSLAIGPDGVTETKANGVSFRTWKSIKRIVVHDRYAFIYVSAVGAFILPLRAFSNEDAWRQFYSEIARHAGVVPEGV